MLALWCLSSIGLKLVTADAASIQGSLIIENNLSPIPILFPGQLFGSFFEDFLHAGDGGVYAEKLSNRAFAQPLANTSSFRCSGAIGTGECTWFVESGDVTRDSSTPLNSAVPYSLWLGPKAVASNAGFPGGIAVRAGDSMSLKLFIYVKAGTASMEARLVDGMGASGRTLGSVMLSQNASTHPKWVQISATLNVQESSGSDGCRFQLLNHAQNDDAKVGVTVVSLFPSQTWMGRANGLRADVASWLNETQPAFIRTPGGCYVEGHDLSASGWAWKQTLGDIQDRPGHMNDVWGYWTDDGLGMLELLQMADDVGARPLLVINAGCSTDSCVSGAALQPYIQDALDAVEYVTGANTTPWGGRRAAAGRSDPFELQALGIGNENCGSRTGKQYPHNWYTIASAVRAKYPKLPLILACETKSQMQQMLHEEPRIRELADMYDVHQRKSPEEFIAAAHEFDSYPRTNFPKLFVSEYSSPRRLFPNCTNLGAAVAEAVYMAGMEANADVVAIATYGDLMANSADTHGSSGVSTILVNAAQSYGSPSWVVQKLFMSAQPTALVPSTLELSSVTPATEPVSGCCGGPHFSKHKDCDVDGRGVWNARENNLTDMAACVAAVSKCKMGNFASFYPPTATDDGACSWHWSCAGWPNAIDSCASVSSAYVTEQLHNSLCTNWTNGGTCELSGVTGTSSSMLAASVSVSSKDEIIAKLVNYNPHEVSLKVKLEKPAVSGELSWMSGDSADLENSFTQPRRVGVQTTPVTLVNGEVVLQLPSWSVSVLKIKK